MNKDEAIKFLSSPTLSPNFPYYSYFCVIDLSFSSTKLPQIPRSPHNTLPGSNNEQKEDKVVARDFEEQDEYYPSQEEIQSTSSKPNDPLLHNNDTDKSPIPNPISSPTTIPTQNQITPNNTTNSNTQKTVKPADQFLNQLLNQLPNHLQQKLPIQHANQTTPPNHHTLSPDTSMEPNSKRIRAHDLDPAQAPTQETHASAHAIAQNAQPTQQPIPQPQLTFLPPQLQQHFQQVQQHKEPAQPAQPAQFVHPTQPAQAQTSSPLNHQTKKAISSLCEGKHPKNAINEMMLTGVISNVAYEHTGSSGPPHDTYPFGSNTPQISDKGIEKRKKGRYCHIHLVI